MKYWVAVAIWAIGCGTSTAPIPPTASFARHLDSLAARACPSVAQFGERCTALRYAEAAPAAGVSPSSVTVQTATGSQTWLGSVFDSVVVDSLGRPFASEVIVVAYSDSNLSDAYLAEAVFSATDSVLSYGAFVLVGDSVNAPNQSGLPVVFDISAASLVGLCHRVPGLVYADTTFPGCHRATIDVLLSSTFAGGFNLPPEFGSLAIASQPIAAVQVVSVLAPQDGFSARTAAPRHGYCGNPALHTALTLRELSRNRQPWYNTEVLFRRNPCWQPY
jgi:hypothetical protein